MTAANKTSSATMGSNSSSTSTMWSSALRFIGLHEYRTFKAIYFFVFASYGVLGPYLPVFFEVLHMSKSQIGILSMIPNFAAFLVAPIVSVIGDHFNAHLELMISSLISSTVLTLGMLGVSTFIPMAGMVVVSSVVKAPLSPQIDAMVISALPDKNKYGEMRLWGAVSYGIMSFVGGVVTATNPKGSVQDQDVIVRKSFDYIFYLYVICMAIGCVFIGKIWWEKRSEDAKVKTLANDGLEMTTKSTLHSSDDSTKGEADEEQEAGMISFEGPQSDAHHNTSNASVISAMLRVFAANPSVGVFSIVVFLSGFGSGVIEAFLFLRMKQLGGSGLVMGISRFITCASEIPMFQVAGYLQNKYGTWPVMALTQLAFVVRFTYYACLTEPWAVLPCEVLHGLTFATMWSVSCTYANMISPPECHSTMQSLLEGLHWGFGSGMGALIGGFAYDSFGAVNLFAASAFLSAFSLALSIFAWYTTSDSEAQTMHSPLSTASDSQHGAAKYSTVKNDEDGEYEEISFDNASRQHVHILQDVVSPIK